jgi:hypothetical protein
MSLARQKGDLDEIGDDDTCEHPSPHDVDAVARVNDPRELGSGGISLCAYHLALWDDIHNGAIAEKYDVGHLIPDDALLHLHDLEAEKERAGVHYKRVGIDHTGRGHYVATDDDGLLLHEIDPVFSLKKYTRPFDHVDVEAYLEQIQNERGWMLVDERYNDLIRGDER